MSLRSPAPAAPRRCVRAAIRALIAVPTAAIAAGCGDPTAARPPAAPPAQTVSVGVYAQLHQTPVTALLIDVTAGDLPHPVVATLPVVEDSVAGTVAVPIGSDRTFTVHGLNAAGTEIYRGAAVLEVRESAVVAAELSLVPLGEGPSVQVTLGTVQLRLDTSGDTVSVGDTTSFGAAVLDARGDTLPGTVRWISLDPALATVDSTGHVVARDTGLAQIVASSGGVSALASVRIVGNAIELENSRAGSRGWFSERWADPSRLAVWASPYSGHVGDSLDVYVNATQGLATVRLYRIGYYGGPGGRLVREVSDVPVAPQPACTPPWPGPVTCPWQRTLRIGTSARWRSGVYVVRVLDAQGQVASYPLVLSDTRAARFLVVIPQLTWQAYNDYGGSSLYTVDPTGAGYEGHFASFERPYSKRGGGTSVMGMGGSNETSAIRYLERERFDVGYISDVELADPASAVESRTRGLIFAGHDEYWTPAMFDRVKRMRDAGTHLAFLSGNNAYWSVRLAPGTVTGRAAQVVVCYRNDPDPGAVSPETATRRMRQLPVGRPENGLMGIMYTTLSNSHFTAMVVSDTAVGAEARQFLAAGGFQPGDTITDTVGGEGDGPVANGLTPPNLQVLFRSPYVPRPGEAAGSYYTTFFVAPGGAGVFAAGTNEFGRALDDFFADEKPSPKLQATFGAVLHWMEQH